MGLRLVAAPAHSLCAAVNYARDIARAYATELASRSTLLLISVAVFDLERASTFNIGLGPK